MFCVPIFFKNCGYNIAEIKNIIVYHNNDKKIEFFLREESIGLSLNQIADFFNVRKVEISKHIKNIYNSRELDKNSTVANFATVKIEGKRNIKRNIIYCYLDFIISVGYRPY